MTEALNRSQARFLRETGLAYIYENTSGYKKRVSQKAAIRWPAVAGILCLFAAIILLEKAGAREPSR